MRDHCQRKKNDRFLFPGTRLPLARRSIMLSAAQNNLNDDTKSALRELHLDHEQDLVVTCDM